MTEVKTYCDRCGKEIKKVWIPKILTHAFEIPISHSMDFKYIDEKFATYLKEFPFYDYGSQYDLYCQSRHKHFELCGDCTKFLKKWMNIT